jgi:hypothetical protein
MIGMKTRLAGLCVVVSTLVCNGATANIEPSAYDAKSIAAGTTGMAYLDNPSALAINPANLARIDRGGMSINITPVISVSQAPLAGPNSTVTSDLGFGPIPSLFEAVRDLVEGGLRASIDHALGVPIAGFGVNANKKLGPACSHYDRWVSRLKAALDPNTASDPFFYAEPDSEPEPDS